MDVHSRAPTTTTDEMLTIERLFIGTPPRGEVVGVSGFSRFPVVVECKPSAYIQGGPKNRTVFFRLDNFVTVSPRKVCSVSKFSKFYREKGTKLAFQ